MNNISYIIINTLFVSDKCEIMGMISKLNIGDKNNESKSIT